MTKFLESYFKTVTSRRSRDIYYRDSITIQTAVSVLRRETRLTREELSERLRVNASKLAYLEATGGLNETQLLVLIDIATEYAMPNLAHYFETKRILYCGSHGGRGRNRRM